MSDQQSKDINKFASMFGLKYGQVSVEKLFPIYFKGADLSKLRNKIAKTVYILENNKSDINELQFIIQKFLSVHNGWHDDIREINNIIRSLGLEVITDTYTVDKISKTSVEDVLHDIEKEVSDELQIDKILPTEILDEGKRMAESYLLIYCFENTLRFFIDKVSTAKYGNGYWNNLTITRDLKDLIIQRKKIEAKNQFHSLRGDNELFYLDMDNLYNIIEHNWDIFRSFFPSQDFIRTRVTETAITRNHVAHNGWISNDDFNRVLGYYKDILKQLGQLK
ncbi:hypothetical protein METP2_02839 [Methanosarcinales archaeon]|nr:hypothetical protein METP2_02839 [Methanosarcinales archaeon]